MNIKLKRFLKGWSQDELAKKSGISRSTICKAENNNVDGIKFSILKKIAKTLDVSFEELFFPNNENKEA